MAKQKRGRGRPKKLVATTPPTVVRAILQHPTPSIAGERANRGVIAAASVRATVLSPANLGLNLRTPPVTTGSVVSCGPDVISIGGVESNLVVEKDCPAPVIGDAGMAWSDVVSGNHLPGHGMAVGFSSPTLVDGEIEIVLEQDDIQSELDYWKNSLIMYVVGDELSMNGVRQFMSKV